MLRSRAGFRFDAEWRITLFTVLMTPFLFGLGVWQLERADEKATLAALYAQRQQEPPGALQSQSRVELG